MQGGESVILLQILSVIHTTPGFQAQNIVMFLHNTFGSGNLIHTFQ